MIGELFAARNKVREQNSAHHYYKVLVVDVYGNYETLLVTDNELERIRDRSRKNRDEQVQPVWHTRLYVSLVRLARKIRLELF